MGSWGGREEDREVGRRGRQGKHLDRYIKRKKIEKQPSENAKSIIIAYDQPKREGLVQNTQLSVHGWTWV